MCRASRPERVTHQLMREFFSYDPLAGRLVRTKKPNLSTGSGRGNVGETVPASLTSGSKYPQYIANILGHFMNYPRAVWLWHHKSTKGRKVRQKEGVERDDFRIEGLELYGTSPTKYNRTD